MADPTPEEAPPLWQVAQYAAIMGLIIGIGAGVVSLGLISLDYFRWRGVPVEQARVTDQWISSSERIACGKAVFNNTWAQVTTFVVADPRPGLPGTFKITGCGIDEIPGEVTTIQRMADDPEDVMLGPKLTARYLALFAGFFLAVGFGLTFLWYTGVGILLPRWHRWVAAGQPGSSGVP